MVAKKASNPQWMPRDYVDAGAEILGQRMGSPINELQFNPLAAVFLEQKINPTLLDSTVMTDL